jgi:hypothetical protein
MEMSHLKNENGQVNKPSSCTIEHFLSRTSQAKEPYVEKSYD